MIEVELKAKLDSLESLKLSLEILGFCKYEEKEEIDLYFNGNNRDFHKTDEALRLRSCEKRVDKDSITKDFIVPNKECFLTYKGPKLDTISQSRLECEVAISDIETMRNILVALGYMQVLQIKKERCYYQKDNITACLDHVDGLGYFIELEKLVSHDSLRNQAINELYDIINSLKIPSSALTTKSYLEQKLGL